MQAVANVLASAVERSRAHERLLEVREAERRRIARDFCTTRRSRTSRTRWRSPGAPAAPAATADELSAALMVSSVAPAMSQDLGMGGEQRTPFPELLESLVAVHRAIAVDPGIELELRGGIPPVRSGRPAPNAAHPWRGAETPGATRVLGASALQRVEFGWPAPRRGLRRRARTRSRRAAGARHRPSGSRGCVSAQHCSRIFRTDRRAGDGHHGPLGGAARPAHERAAEQVRRPLVEDHTAGEGSGRGHVRARVRLDRRWPGPVVAARPAGRCTASMSRCSIRAARTATHRVDPRARGGQPGGRVLFCSAPTRTAPRPPARSTPAPPAA